MGSSPTPAATRRYLVHCDDAAGLGEIIAGIKADPQLHLEQVIGPAGAPHTAVVLMNPQQAEALRQRFLRLCRLTIEPDQPLSPFAGPA